MGSENGNAIAGNYTHVAAPDPVAQAAWRDVEKALEEADSALGIWAEVQAEASMDSRAADALRLKAAILKFRANKGNP